MKPCVMIVALLMLAPACAASPSGAARTPVAAAHVPAIGTWAGTMTSLDMATASGTAEAPARLTIMAGGRFTLTGSGGTVVAGVARRAGNSLVLDGTVMAGDPMAVGRAMSFVLEPRGPNALFGGGQTFHLGHRIDTGIALRRV